jgi:hypothetical protein
MDNSTVNEIKGRNQNLTELYWVRGGMRMEYRNKIVLLSVATGVITAVCLFFLLVFIWHSMTPSKRYSDEIIDRTFTSEYLIKLKKCGVKNGAKLPLEVRVMSNGKQVYSSLKNYPNAVGAEFTFDDTFVFRYASGSRLSVLLLIKGILLDTAVIEASSNTPDCVDDLLNRRLERKGSFVEFGKVNQPGRYAVSFKRFYIGPEVEVNSSFKFLCCRQ